MNPFNEYLQRVLREVRWKTAHSSIRRELSDHLEDQFAANRAAGMGEQEAASEALRDMGNAQMVGRALDAAYQPRPTLDVLLPALTILFINLVMVVLVYAPMEHYENIPGETIYLQLIALLIGGVFLTAAYLLSVRRLLWGAFLLYGLSVFFTIRNANITLAVNYTLSNYAMLVLPLCTVGICCALHRLGVWRFLLAGLFLLAPFLWMFSRGYYYRDHPAISMALLIGGGGLLFSAITAREKKTRWLGVLFAAVPLLLLLHNIAYPPDTIQRNIRIAFDADYASYAPMIRSLMPAAWDDVRGPCLEILDKAPWLGPVSGLSAEAERFLFVGYGNPEYDIWRTSSQWYVAVNQPILNLVVRYGKAPALLLVLILLTFLALGYRRALRLSSPTGKSLGFAVLLSFTIQALGDFCSIGGDAYRSSPYPLPFLSIGYYALILNMAQLGVLLSVLRTDGLPDR